MSTLLGTVEALTEEVYGYGSAVSVDREGKGWTVRCWNAKGAQVESTGLPLAKHDALATMKRRLQRTSFLRLDPSDMGLSDG